MPFQLHDAARQGDVAGIQKLLLDTETTQVNGKDKHSRTALHLASWAGHTDAVRVLLANGANAHAGAMDDMNALHFAAQKGHAGVIELLLIAGINVNAKTRKGLNALQIAAQQGHLEATQMLLKKGASPLAANNKGQTAAQLAKTAEVREVLQKAESTARERQQIKAQRQAVAKGKPQPPEAAGARGPRTSVSEPAVRQPSSAAGDAAPVAGPTTAVGPAAQPPASSTAAASPAGHAGQPAAERSPTEVEGAEARMEEDPAVEVCDVAIGPALGPSLRAVAGGGGDDAATGASAAPDVEQHTEPIGPAMPPGWGSGSGEAAAGNVEAQEHAAAEEQPDRHRPEAGGAERPPAKKARVVLSHLGDEEDE